MKLGWWRSGVGRRGLGFIAPFSLGSSFPIQAYTVVARLALTFTIVTLWSFFPTLDLPVLAGPVMFSKRWGQCMSMHTDQQPLRLRFLGSALPGFFGRGMSK